jgi:cytochrome P450
MLEDLAKESGQTSWPVVQMEPLGEELADNFWDVMTRVREECPVGWNHVAWNQTEVGQWLVNDYESVMDAATQWQRFSSAGGTAPMQYDLEVMRMIPVETDPPIHRSIRKALNPFFTPAYLESNIDPIIDRSLAELLEQCAEDTPIDFMAQMAAPLPVRVFFLGFLGQDLSVAAPLMVLTDSLNAKPETAAEAAPKLMEWCAELLRQRRAEGRRDDLPGLIAHLGLDGTSGELRLSDRERIETLNLMVMAGMDTTLGGLGTVAWLLATRPGLRAELRDADDALLDDAVDEFLRFGSNVPTLARTVAVDTEFGSCPMKKGDRMLLNWAAANLDPLHFPNPMDVDVHRENAGSHVAFGAGIHRCLGAHLAKREIKAMVKAICSLSRFDLEPGAEVKFRAKFARGPAELPILLKN